MEESEFSVQEMNSVKNVFMVVTDELEYWLRRGSWVEIKNAQR